MRSDRNLREATLDRLKGLSFALVRRLLGWLTEPMAIGVDTLPPHPGVVYVLQYRSLTDLVMLDLVTAANALPRPRASLVDYGVPERLRFVFLNRPSGFLLRRNSMRTYSARLLRLQRYVRDARRAELSLVPVTVFWSRAPQRERSLIRVLLSEDWTATSRFRRFVTIVFNRHDISVHFGAPLELRAIAGPDVSDARVVRRVARLLRVQFKRQRIAVLGPDLSHRRTLVDQIVASRAVRAAIAGERASPERATRRAQRYARGIASDMSYITIRVLQRLLTWFWSRIYDGIDERGIGGVRQLAETATLVYVPCHRSHVDYLVLSYLLNREGLMIPHVAAGENLDVPLLGSVLRRGGAFFIRRSFGNDRLYAAVFAEYLYRLVQRGAPSEYFIEGGRSRTGSLLPPRTGLLKQTIAAHARGVPRPIMFVPVNIGYEKLIESRSYLAELRGERKRRESLLDVVRSLRLLREDFGRVHADFGAPLPLDAFLADHPATQPDTARALGVELLTRINACAYVNPINLIALVTLGMPRQTIDESLLIEQLDCLAALLRADAPTSGIAVTDLDGRAMVAHAEHLGMIVRESHPFGDVLGHDASNAVLMTWYRNTVRHALALPALIACLLVNRPRGVTRVQLLRNVATVYPYFCSELYLRAHNVEADVARWLGHLAERGLVRIIGDTVAPPPIASTEHYRLMLLAQIVIEILERYFIAIGILQRAGQHTIDRATLETDCVTLARRLSRLYRLNAPEFFEARWFRNFIDTLIDRGVVHLDPDGRLGYEVLIDEVTRASSVVLNPEFRMAVLRARAPQRADDQRAATDSPR